MSNVGNADNDPSQHKGLLNDGIFYCDHIRETDTDIIAGFEQKHSENGNGLANYLKNTALKHEKMGWMRTYLVKDVESDELVGYFSIKAGMVSVAEREIIVDTDTGETEMTFDALPGIELANLGVNNAYQSNHEEMRGIGVLIFRHFVLPIVNDIPKTLGVALLYIFALPFDELIDRYSRVYGFRRLDSKSEDDLHKRVKPFYDLRCIFMYQLL